MRVLTVDDDEMGLEMLNLALEEAGHDVVSASDGREALEMLQTNPCRMVITDWEMPEMNGIELCKAIRRGEFGGYVYVILLTGHDSADETVEGLSAGADDFIGKPFHPEELAVRVGVGERILSLETRDVVIFSMARLAESRDPETGAHLDRVRGYCRVVIDYLAEHGRQEYRRDAAYANLIYLTSPLHDIGKIGIPDSVLLKPGRLSDREYEIMKTHASIGAEALAAAIDQFPDASFLRMARDIAATHHERFDGTGYPRGLVGENIPLCGRIAALADVYDALTSKRAYKNAFKHEVSRGIILEESGTHFDPQIVEAFTEREEEFIQIRQRFQDSSAEMAA